jgi:hypothetical protein
MLGGDVRRPQSANHSPTGVVAARAEQSSAPRIASAASAIALTVTQVRLPPTSPGVRRRRRFG